MGWISTLSENIKKSIRDWLNIDTNQYSIHINELFDFETTAIRNRIWYRGDSNELEQLYTQNMEYADKYKFWASKSTPGMEMRKIHTGLPGLMVTTLVSVVLPDMNAFEFKSETHKALWERIAKENKFKKSLETYLSEVLCIGDGAFKITFDTQISPYPILEWYPGDRIEVIYNRGRIKEIVFKTPYKTQAGMFILLEHYGYGYITNELYKDNKQVELSALEETKNIKPYSFNEKLMLAVMFKVYKNKKYEGRGGSIYDGKLDSFDALDETWSQWMDALRAGRAKTYIPESYLPKDPNTGKVIAPNPFDNRFIASEDNMSEGAENVIKTEQPDIPHESYLASYCTALDLCLQGIISPSTLGIDVKKLDNAEAQREKEKTTLYTRNAIIGALQETLPELISAAVNAVNVLNKKPVEDVDVNITFGEYANPSFESQIETIGKGKTQGIMSIEACIEELYGDSKDEEWKAQEVQRIKEEQGITQADEKGVNGDYLMIGAANE